MFYAHINNDYAKGAYSAKSKDCQKLSERLIKLEKDLPKIWEAMKSGQFKDPDRKSLEKFHEIINHTKRLSYGLQNLEYEQDPIPEISKKDVLLPLERAENALEALNKSIESLRNQSKDETKLIVSASSNEIKAVYL